MEKYMNKALILDQTLEGFELFHHMSRLLGNSDSVSRVQQVSLHNRRCLGHYTDEHSTIH